VHCGQDEDNAISSCSIISSFVQSWSRRQVGVRAPICQHSSPPFLPVASLLQLASLLSPDFGLQVLEEQWRHGDKLPWRHSDIDYPSSSSMYSLSRRFPVTWPCGDDVTSRRSAASRARRISVVRSRSLGWRRQHPVMTLRTSGGQQRGGSSELPDCIRWMTYRPTHPHALFTNEPDIGKQN